MPTNGGRRRAAKRAGTNVMSQAPSSTPTAAVEVPPTSIFASPAVERTVRQWMEERREQRRRYNLFYLVQLLDPVHFPSNTRVGLDRFFDLEYMGSAEFDWVSVQDSLKRIRAAGELEMVMVEMTKAGVTNVAFVVGPKEGLDDKIDEFRRWFETPGSLRSREQTYFEELFTGQFGPFHTREYIRTRAWWSLNADIGWAMDDVAAQQLLDGFALHD